MKSASSFAIRLLGGCGVALVVGGCAVGNVPLFKKFDAPDQSAAAAKDEQALPDIHPMRKERSTAAAKKFDIERNNAEYQAAAAEWRQGNFKASRDGLEKILHRDAAHRESLILLAEIELEQDQSEKAVATLRRGIEAHPEDAELSYKLGLALEAAGEESEALHHFHIAVQLAPHEKKFAEVFEHAEAHARGSSAAAEAISQPDRVTQTQRPAVKPAIQLASNEVSADNAAEADAEFDGNVDAETENTVESAASPAATAEPAESTTPAEPPSVLESTRPVGADMFSIEAAAADWDAGRKAACVKSVAAILARDPKHIEANILQVEIDLDAGRNDEARARIERLAIRNPQSAQVRRACGLAYQALGDTARADSAFAMAETLELGAIEDTTPRAELARDEAKQAAATRRMAVPTSTNTLAIQPVSSVSSLPAQTPDDEAARPNELAAETFEPAMPIVGVAEEAPTRAPTRRTATQHLEKGEVFLKAGRYDDARRELSAAISAKTCDVKTASAAALAPLKYEQSEQALSLAREGLKKYPDSAGLHRIEGTAALRLGRHLEAEAALRQSLNLDNSQALTYFLLGSVYDRLGNKEAATRHLGQASRLDRRYAARK